MSDRTLIPPRNHPLNPVQRACTGRIPRTVLILGARGRLGYACVQAFARDGWRVLAHVRPGSSILAGGAGTEQPDSEVNWIAPPLDAPAAWQALAKQCGGVDVVVNALAPKFSTTAWAKELLPLTQLGVCLARDLHALLIQPLSILSAGTQLPKVWREDDLLPDAADSRLATLRCAAPPSVIWRKQQRRVCRFVPCALAPCMGNMAGAGSARRWVRICAKALCTGWVPTMYAPLGPMCPM